MRSTLATLALFVPALASAIPMSLQHQGRLLDSTGTPLTGDHEVTVSLYDDADNSLWTDTFTAVPFDGGYFSVVLGSGTALDAGALAGDTVFVGLAVDGTDIGSRQQLHAVPYAVFAEEAFSVKGGTVDVSEVKVDGTTVIDGNGLAGGLSSDTLAELSCSEGQVAKLAGGTWTCSDDALNTDAGALDSGTLDAERLLFGTKHNEVAHGDHGHAIADLSGDLPANRVTGLPAAVVESQVLSWVTANGFARSSDIPDESAIIDVVSDNGYLTKDAYNAGFGFSVSKRQFRLNESDGWQKLTNFDPVTVTTTGNPVWFHTSIQMNDDVGISDGRKVAMACNAIVDGTSYLLGQKEHYGWYNYEWIYTYSVVLPIDAGEHTFEIECAQTDQAGQNMSSQIGNRGHEDPIGSKSGAVRNHQDLIMVMELGRQ